MDWMNKAFVRAKSDPCVCAKGARCQPWQLAAGKAFCLCSHLTAEVFCQKWKHLQMSSLYLIFIKMTILYPHSPNCMQCLLRSLWGTFNPKRFHSPGVEKSEWGWKNGSFFFHVLGSPTSTPLLRSPLLPGIMHILSPLPFGCLLIGYSRGYIHSRLSSYLTV